MNIKALTLQAEIDAKRTEQRNLGKYEVEMAFEIRQLIRQQAILSDEILMLEYDLDKIRREKPKATPTQMVNAAERLLRSIGL